MNNEKSTKRLIETCKKIQAKNLKNLIRLRYFTNNLCLITKDYFECTGEYPSIETVQKFLSCPKKEAYDLIYAMKAIDILNRNPLAILDTESEQRLRKTLEQIFK